MDDFADWAMTIGTREGRRLFVLELAEHDAALREAIAGPYRDEVAAFRQALQTIAYTQEYESCIGTPWCTRWRGRHAVECAVRVARDALERAR